MLSTLLLLVACLEPGEPPESAVVPGQPHAEDEEEDTGSEAPGSPIYAAAVGLENDVPVTGLAGARLSKKTYTFAVPAGATGLAFVLSGGTGDADVYVRFGTPPTTSAYDFRPYLNGNDETVTPPVATEGTWHIMVRGYAAYAGATLVARYQPPGGGEPPAPDAGIDAGEPPAPDAGIDAGEPPAPDGGIDAGVPVPVPDAGGGGGTDCTVAASWPADWAAFEDQVLVLVNQHRAAGATCGGVAKPAMGPLVMDAALRRAARCHSLDMATNDYFSHTSQDGRSPWTRIDQAGYTANATGENIAAGQATPASVVSGWMTSTGHCDNIMNANSNEIGVGYALDASSTYDKYWTQTFGRR